MRGEPVSHILAFARRLRAQRAEDMTLGKMKTLDAYREGVGFIAAMDAIETEIKKLSGFEQEI